ncbi:MAG TPA: glutamate racemase, partial [Candidatus Omnitrophica bacterium]|nr:glutamate racemase [Candidatus Omnitrophota bacterium]
MPEDIHARPIGIFDSGVGGLTLFKSIRNLLPNERLLYFGDTARLPYGTKSPNAVRRFSLQIARFLERFRIKALVVACHTASSTALVDLKIAMKIPVVGVIEPTVKKAIQVTRNKNIGVIGTKTTIASNSFQSHLKKASPSVFVTAIPAPLLVPLVEEGWVDRELTRMILKEYLSIFKKREIDTLILGCTHYPLLKTLFQEE